MTKLALSLALILLPLAAQGQLPAETEKAEITPLSLAELAAQADLVALVQIADTDYEYTRDFPSGGTAFLKVLIPYKVTRALEDLIEVYEEGLHDFECYFPNPTVLEEGRRFLVFLRFSAEVNEQYNGLAQGCALEVLVTRENRYALRYPLEGMALLGDHGQHAAELAFADAYALVDDNNMSPDKRNAFLKEGWLVEDGERYRFTHGIDLSRARQLLGPEILTLDRSLK